MKRKEERIMDMNMNMNTYFQHPYQPPKKNKMGLGILIGFFIGMGSFMLLFMVAVIGYSAVTGKYLVMGKNKVTTANQNQLIDQETADKIDEVSQYMNLYYYEEYNLDDIRTSMIKGIVSGLGDPYSVYYTPEEYQSLQESTSGNYYGIGAGLTQDKDTMEVSITKIYKGTPSEEAGLLKGDIIKTVAGTEATSMELSELVKMIRGEEGTTVTIEIYRPSTEENLTFEVERKDITLPSVESKMIDGEIGYIQISEFQTTTAEQFETQLSELEQKGMQGLIVDVRGNPGGLLSSVTTILDRLLPEGVLVSTKDKNGYEDSISSDANCVNYPIVVLVDENSASASEIFAGAIKDYEYGTIVGTKTFGKGIVQSIFPLSNGDAIKITTSKYYTPNGNYIHGVGIEPDVEIEYEYTGDANAEYDMTYDNQLQKGLELIKEDCAK